MTGFSFQFPWALILLPAIAYLAWRYGTTYSRYQVGLRFPGLQGLPQKSAFRARLMPLLPALRVGALTLGVLALARPQVHSREEKVRTDVVDIMLAMDVSGSMLARDFEPNRLEVSKRMAARFVDARPKDRLGLVAFAGESYTQCPLTLDHRQLKATLDRLASGVLDDGTAMGLGLGMAVARLKDSPTKSKIAILLTDGVNNAGDVPPATAAELARSLGVKVYTIGIGSRGLAQTPIARRQDGVYVFGISEVNIDEALLQQIADTTGGKYFRATSEASLSAIYSEIDRLERTRVEVAYTRRDHDLFRWCLVPALLLLLAEILLRNSWLKTLA